MGRKTKYEIEFENRKSTIYECLNSGYYSWSDQDDKLFVTLLLAGYSASMAYRYAYHTTASLQSCAVLACRKTKEPYVQNLLRMAVEQADSGYLYLSKKGFKGKMRWEPWRGKRVPNINTSIT